MKQTKTFGWVSDVLGGVQDAALLVISFLLPIKSDYGASGFYELCDGSTNQIEQFLESAARTGHPEIVKHLMTKTNAWHLAMRGACEANDRELIHFLTARFQAKTEQEAHNQEAHLIGADLWNQDHSATFFLEPPCKSTSFAAELWENPTDELVLEQAAKEREEKENRGSRLLLRSKPLDQDDYFHLKTQTNRTDEPCMRVRSASCEIKGDLFDLECPHSVGEDVVGLLRAFEKTDPGEDIAGLLRAFEHRMTLDPIRGTNVRTHFLIAAAEGYARNGNVEKVQEMRTHCPSLNLGPCFVGACRGGHLALAQSLPRYRSAGALVQAAFQGKTDVVRWLLTQNIYDEARNDALAAACCGGHQDIVVALRAVTQSTLLATCCIVIRGQWSLFPLVYQEEQRFVVAGMVECLSSQGCPEFSEETRNLGYQMLVAKGLRKSTIWAIQNL